MTTGPSLIQRVCGKIWQTVAVRWRYWKTYEFSGEWDGFQLVRRVWQVRPLGRLGLAALILGAIVAASQIETIAAQPLGAEVALPTSITIIGAALFALGWAFALSAAMSWPLWGYFIVAAYLSWQGLFIAGSLAGTPLFALSTLWMLLLGWRIARNEKGHWRVWLFSLCCGAAYLTYGAFGLRRIFTGEWEVLAPIVLGLIYFVALTNRYTRQRFPQTDQQPKADRVFWLTLIVIGTFFTLGIARDPTVAAQKTLLTMRGLLGVVDLFWLWLGASLFQGAIGLGKWLTNESVSLLSARVARVLFPLIWISVAIFGWIATHDVPIEVAVFAHNLGLSDWVNTWNDPDYWGVYYQVFASLVAVTILIILIVQRRWTNDKLAWLSGVWLAAYIGVVGFYSNFESFGTLEADAAAPLAFWTGLALIGGLVWEMAKSNADWSKASNERIFALLAGLLLMLSVCVVTLGAGLPELVMEYTLYSFLGVIYLGLPLVAYDFVCERTGYEPLSMWNLLALFVIGAVSASLVLGIDPYAGAHFLIAPIVWAIGLQLVGQRLARLTSALDGFVAGGALALGFVTFWMSPQILPIPFFSLWQQWQDRYMLVALNRPLLLDSQWWFTLIALGAGMLIGWAFTRRWRVRVAAALIGAIALAVIAPSLPGMPTGEQSVSLMELPCPPKPFKTTTPII